MCVQSTDHFQVNDMLSMISDIKTDGITLEKERIEVLRQLHTVSTRSKHLIAKLLLSQDNVLK